jgi:hypothetical protein
MNSVFKRIKENRFAYFAGRLTADVAIITVVSFMLYTQFLNIQY